MEYLGCRVGIARLLVEGCGGLNRSMLRAGLVDELSPMLAPAVFDGDGKEAASLGMTAASGCNPASR